MDTDQLLAPQPRWFEIVVGIISALIGLALFAFRAFFVYRTYDRPIRSRSLVLHWLTVDQRVFLEATVMRLISRSTGRMTWLAEPGRLDGRGMNC